MAYIVRKENMSLSQSALMHRDMVPTHSELQAAIDGSGFDLKLDSFYVPFESSGFHPCILNGEESGFEVYWQPITDILSAWPELEAPTGSRDTSLTFIWHGDMSECACVLIVSAALAKAFDAVVFYQDDAILYTTDQLIEEANAVLGDL